MDIDYYEKSVAHCLATCLKSGIVWASDGTVESKKQNHIFSHNTVYYMLQNDKIFQDLCNKKGSAGRDSYA